MGKLTNHKSLIKSFAPRIIKYAQRGFDFIAPKQFNIVRIEEELRKYLKQQSDEDVKVNEKWTDNRRKSLRECFVEHGWIAERMYGCGFGLNNDFFGMRRLFSSFVLTAHPFGGFSSDKTLEYGTKTEYDNNLKTWLRMEDPDVLIAAVHGDLEQIKKHILNGDNLSERRKVMTIATINDCNGDWSYFGDSALHHCARVSKRAYSLYLKGVDKEDNKATYELNDKIIIELLLHGADPLLKSRQIVRNPSNWREPLMDRDIKQLMKKHKNIVITSIVNRVYKLWRDVNKGQHIGLDTASYADRLRYLWRKTPNLNEIKAIIDDVLQ